MSSRRLQGTVAMEGVEVADVPGTAEEGREGTLLGARMRSTPANSSESTRRRRSEGCS